MKVRIIAKPPLQVARIDAASGEPLSVRPVGYDAQGVALPEGEVIDDHAHYRRAARRGEIELYTETVTSNG